MEQKLWKLEEQLIRAQSLEQEPSEQNSLEQNPLAQIRWNKIH
jgi:hypothetical protein